jgi:hypothetical protein
MLYPAELRDRVLVEIACLASLWEGLDAGSVELRQGRGRGWRCEDKSAQSLRERSG